MIGLDVRFLVAEYARSKDKAHLQPRMSSIEEIMAKRDEEFKDATEGPKEVKEETTEATEQEVTEQETSEESSEEETTEETRVPEPIVEPATVEKRSVWGALFPPTCSRRSFGFFSRVASFFGF